MDTNEQGISKLAVGAKTGLIGAVGGRFLNVFANILIARLLGPAIFGLYAIGWTLLRFFSLIVPLGMDRAVLRFAPKYWQQDDSKLKGLFSKVHLIALGSGLTFGIVFFLLSPWLATSVYHQPELLSVFRLFSFAFPLLSLLTVSAAATRITQRIHYSMWLYDLGQPILGLLLIIIFFLIGLGLNGIVLAEVISLGAAVVFAIPMLGRVFPELMLTKSVLGEKPVELLKYSLPAMLGGAFSVYVLWIDRIFVGLFLPPYDNGIYVAVSQISTILVVINAGLSPIAVPLFSQFFHQHNHEKLEEVYRISTRWGCYISIPILAVLLVSPENSLFVIFGEKFTSGAPILLLLLAGQVVNLVTGSVNPLMIMTDNQKIVMRISTIVLVLDVFLLVTLISLWGLIGAAVSTSVSLIVLYLYQLFWVKRNLNLWPYDKKYRKGIIAGCLCFLAVFLTSLLVTSSPVISIIIEAIISLAVFIGMLLIQKLEPEDREFLKSFRARF